jgi:hypothetical protein
MGYTERMPYLMQPWITSLYLLHHSIILLATDRLCIGCPYCFDCLSRSSLILHECIIRYVDCPPNLVFDASPNETLRCPTADEVRRYEDAIRRGDIVFNAVPFNLQPEAMSPGLFEGSMQMVRVLCRRYNMSDDECGTVMSGRDVPGLTRGILPLLKKHGVKGINVGTNGCVEPSFPWDGENIQSMKPFVWRDNASDVEIVTIWEQGYGPGEFKSRQNVQVLPSGHALALQFMSDNAGAASSVSEVLQYYQSLRNAFPGAKIVPSSLDNFYAEAYKVKDQLAVTVTGEVGDVWMCVTCHGTQRCR